MSRLLVTGFEPFGVHAHNPSSAILERLPDRLGHLPVDKSVLPVETDAVKPMLARLHARPYRAILHLGLAEDRAVPTVERRAVNLLSFTINDNRGVMIRGAPIVEGGPEALAARLPVDEILGAWEQAGIPAAPSDSAGTFLCNQVMYESLRALPEEIQTGFIHLPPDETIGRGRAHVPLELQARAILLALQVIARSV